MMRKSTILVLCASVACFLMLGSQAQADEDKSKPVPLRVNVMNDIPGPVEVRVQGYNPGGKMLVDAVMVWDDNNNIFSTETLDIPKQTRILRFTFINDYFDGTGEPDGDRNAFIDYFTLKHNRYEAEDFNRTGGPDPVYPGCDVTTFPARTTAGCGNEGDWVEYDLLTPCDCDDDDDDEHDDE